MASISNVVNVTITKGTLTVPQAGFGIGLILASFTDWTDRLRVYSGYAAVLTDFPSNTMIQAAAEAYFGADSPPTSLIIGRIEATDTNAVAALQAVSAINNTWYALMLLDHTEADVQAMATYIQTQQKIFITSSQDPTLLTSTTTDIAAVLKAATTTRTSVLYSGTADTVWPECAWVGRMLPTSPGAATWKFKQLNGITVDNLTDSQVSFAQGKNANVYIQLGGVSVTAEGTMADGEFIDTIVFIDWLVSTMQTNVYSLLVNSDKVPYTNKGIAVVQNAVQQTLTDGIARQGLASAPAPVVTVPNVLNVPSADKSTRTLNNVSFTATLAGAIHKINIHGTVAV